MTSHTLRGILGGVIVWLAFSVFTTIAYKFMGVDEDWFFCAIDALGLVTLITLLGAAVFYGLWLMGAPI